MNKTGKKVRVYGVCDYTDCPHNVGKKEFWDDGKCSYHPENCYIDEKPK